MALTTVSGDSILSPEQVTELLIEPVQSAAIALAEGITTSVVLTDAGHWRVPRVTDDPVAAWVNEGQEIAPSDPAFDEVIIVPAKVAGLTVVTRELVEDTVETAPLIVGDGLIRDLARKIDAAFLTALPAPAPAGLTTIGYQEIAGGTLSNLDRFAQAVSVAEDVGALLTGWVTSPATALTLATLKDRADSNATLLGVDPALPSRRLIEGRPLLVSPDVPDGQVWGLPASRVYTVIRSDAEVSADASVFFTSDRIAVRATMRLAFGFVHEPAVVHLTFDAIP